MTTQLIAVTGPKGSGKDTGIAPLLDEGYVLIKFADTLKNMLRVFLREYGVDDIMIERMIEGDLKEVPHPAFCGRTPRHSMQTLGTEWGRMMLGPKVWTNIYGKKVARTDRVITTDMRFLNESGIVEEIKKTGVDVQTVRVVRTGMDRPMDVHQSEVELWSLPVVHVVHNEGTVAELQDKMRAIAAPAQQK